MDVGSNSVRKIEQPSLFGTASEPVRKVSTNPEEWHVPMQRTLQLELSPGGERVTLDWNSGCSKCHSGSCSHMKVLDDVINVGHRGLRYELKSAMHKEIRKGDVQAALQWARWGAYFHGNSWPKTYVKGVVLEETCSPRLAREWRSMAKRSPQDVVATMASVRKKWEVTARVGFYADYMETFVSSEGLASLTDHVVQGKADKAHTRKDLLKLFWQAVRLRDNKTTFTLADALGARAIAAGGIAKTWAEEKLWGTHPFFGPLVLIEMMTGAWSSDADDLVRNHKARPLHEEDAPLVLAVPDYAFDCHTSLGRRRMVAGWSQIAPGRPQPSGVDLRWSGMLLGVAWREFASRQFPSDYQNRKWEEVEIPKDVWENSLACDRFFYTKFYEQLDSSKSISVVD